MAKLEISSLKELHDRTNVLIRTHLWAQILVGMVLGIGIGLILSPSGMGLVPDAVAFEIASWVALPGQIFLAIIQMVVIPLVISSIALGIVSSGDLNFLKRIGLRIGPYFVFTTTVAVVIGVVVATIIQPGSYIDSISDCGVF